MSDVFFSVVVVFLVAFFAISQAKNAIKKSTASAGKTAKAVPSTQDASDAAPAPAAAAAPIRPTTLKSYTPGFVSLEDQASETDWHEAEMTGEGKDPCHDEMYAGPIEDHENTKHAESPKEAREWARAVIMAEILKRPSERRWGARGRS
ncbi:MAG: hypothetical protein IKP22_06630 [Clostridia bacterium]|nr:hypothetical protein [Clostridia bacterium]